MTVMSATREFQQIARQYEAEAERYPEGHLGRIGNLAEAAKYHGLAAKAATWPRREESPDDRP
jgi:hypothetical protein